MFRFRRKQQIVLNAIGRVGLFKTTVMVLQSALRLNRIIIFVNELSDLYSK